MYTEHFGFSRAPFARDPGEDFFIANPTVAAAATRVAHGLGARDAVVLVSGGPGVGKTSLVEYALAGIAPGVTPVRADLRGAEADELFVQVLAGLGEDGSAPTVAAALARLKDALRRQRSAGSPVVVSLDLAGFSVELARRLLRLVNLSGEQGCQLGLVLQGPHTLHQAIDVPGLIHLRQRVVFRHRVRPLTLVETGAYLRHAFEKAGKDMDSFAASNVGASVYLYVAGVPRLINTLTDAVLAEAASQQIPRIDAEVIRNVAEGLGWKPLGGKPAVAPPPPAPKAAARKPAAPVVPARPTASSPELAMSDATSRLLAVRGGESGDAGSLLSLASDDPAPRLAEKPATEKAEPARGPALVAMDPIDPGATGMLKLEDLDPRIAEKLFAGDDN